MTNSDEDQPEPEEHKVIDRTTLTLKWEISSVTRLGNFLNFGQLFKAIGNN